MAKKKKIDYDKYAAGLFSRTEQYTDRVRRHYASAVDELLKLTAWGDLGSSGAFSFGDDTKLSEKANSILRGLYSAVYGEIKNGVQAEWEYANLSCDALIESIFGKGLQESNHFARWFSRNKDAMDSFFKRKSAYGGLNLSQKVWKYTGDLKTEMECALTISLGQGDSAATVSRRVREYLQEPDKMFRRFRVKTGEKKIYDEEGNVIGTEPIYGRRWKRKVIDPQTGEVTWENFNPRDYHSGRGVYRSSYKNAMRLTRTETNMAYRTAEQDRWQRLDFVVGYEIKLSNNHPQPDICNDLKGKYPKDFVFKGWHPQCRCYVVPILASQEEFIKMEKDILDGKEPQIHSENVINDVPKNFKEWMNKNSDRIEAAENKPYFIRDNAKYADPYFDLEKVGQRLVGKGNNGIIDEIDNYLLPQSVREKLEKYHEIKTYRDFQNFMDNRGISVECALPEMESNADIFYEAPSNVYQRLSIAVDTYREYFGSDCLNSLKKIVLYDQDLGAQAAYFYNKIGELDPLAGQLHVADWNLTGHKAFHELAHVLQDSWKLPGEDAVACANRLVKKCKLSDKLGTYFGASREAFDAERFADAFGYGFTEGHQRKYWKDRLLFIQNVWNESKINTTHILSETTLEKSLKKLRKSLIRQDHEKMVIVNNKGASILDMRGDSRSVRFDEDVARLIKNNYISHNHPTSGNTTIKQFGYSLSRDDVYEAVRCDARGIIAETKNYRYSIQRPNNGWNVDAETLKQRYTEIYNDLRTKYLSSIEYHDAAIILQHFVMKQLSKEYDLNYVYKRL